MGILRRTVYFAVDDRDKTNVGLPLRPSDWASVTTTLGAAVEPYNMWPRTSSSTAKYDYINYDFNDQIVRVDSIEFVPLFNINSPFTYADKNGQQLHGGKLIPRVGP